MKKIVILALSCVMAAGLFTGCRRRPVNETVTPTVTTRATTAPTVHTTQPTQNTTHATEATRNTTVPEVIPGVTGATNGTESTGRSRQARPSY